MKIDCVDIDEYRVENPDRMDEIKKMCNNKMDFCKKPQYLLWWLELLLNKCSSFKNYKCKAGIEASPDELHELHKCNSSNHIKLNRWGIFPAYYLYF